MLDKVRYTNDILLPHELLHGASAIYKQVQHTCPAHLAKQGTQRPCGVRPQLHVAHTADTSAGPRGAPVRRP